MSDSPAEGILSADIVALARNASISHSPCDEVVAGDPTSGEASLGEFNGLELGAWEMTPGVVEDTEVDELFVVVDGRGQVEFLESGEILQLAPGSIGRLIAGQRTRWTVSETLRKVYLC